MKNKTIYILWTLTYDRPLIAFGNYGNILAYLTREQAEAYKEQNHKGDFNIEIKEVNTSY